MIRLVNHTKAPPGQFFIRIRVRDGDWEATHDVCGGDGLCKQFGPLPTVGYVAKELLGFLRGNGLPRADIGTLASIIDSYTCQRLGNGRKWCYDSDRNVADSSPTVLAATGKGCCGNKL
jgi:hypothetical protein